MPLVRLKNITLNYTEAGRGTPLILLMGLGADGSMWDLHVKEYSKHFRCIKVDNRGVGLSDKPEGPYTTAEMAADVAGLMVKLNITKAHISGISLGGAIAQELAINYPGLIRSLTLNCSWGRCDNYMVRIFRELKELYGKITPAMWTRHLNLLIFSRFYYEKHLKDIRKREEKALKPVKNPQPGYAFGAQCAACSSHDTEKRLKNIKAPVLITAGDSDIFIPVENAVELSDKIPGAKIHIYAKCGHVHHWEKLEEFNRRTTAYLLAH